MIFDRPRKEFSLRYILSGFLNRGIQFVFSQLIILIQWQYNVFSSSPDGNDNFFIISGHLINGPNTLYL